MRKLKNYNLITKKYNLPNNTKSILMMTNERLLAKRKAIEVVALI